MTVSITNVVNVSVSTPQTGLGEYSVNNVALFTHENPVSGWGDFGYMIVRGSSPVVEEFGSDSQTAKMASIVFSQRLSLLSGNGVLIIAPMAGATLALSDITDLAKKIYFVGTISTVTNPSDSNVLALAQGVQGLQNKVLYAPISTIPQISGLGTDIKNGTLTNTRILYHSDPEMALLLCAGVASKMGSVNYYASNTSLTMHLKVIEGILPDNSVNDTVLANLKTAGVDAYVNIAGLPRMLTSGENEFLDVVMGMIWLQGAFEINYFNTLATTRTKIPQTERGMDSIKSALRMVCRIAVLNQTSAPGFWDGDKFGNEEDLMRNIEDQGYYIWSLPVREQLTSERRKRIAPIIQIGIKLASAVHSGNLIVQINP